MTIERRLQHAARELREVEIVVPPLGRPNRQPTRILQALAAPMLFVAGGLFAYGAVQTTPVSPPQSDIVTVPAIQPVIDTAADSSGVPAAPSVRAELQMIAELMSRPVTTPVVPVNAPASGRDLGSPTGSSMTESVGPL